MMAHEDCGPTIEVHSKKVGELIAERDEWKAKGEKLAEAVEKIARHPHNDYNTVSNGRYEIGVVDGHRCAALIAGAALEEWRKE
jgi:hypothetical protein